MTAPELLAECFARGISLRSHKGRLRVEAPKGVLTAELRLELREHRDQLLELVDDPIGRFLDDSDLAAGIFYSNALDRDFVLARDEESLESLTEADRELPALFFRDCVDAKALGLEGLRALLDVRETLGPLARLRSVRRGYRGRLSPPTLRPPGPSNPGGGGTGGPE